MAGTPVYAEASPGLRWLVRRSLGEGGSPAMTGETSGRRHHRAKLDAMQMDGRTNPKMVAAEDR